VTEQQNIWLGRVAGLLILSVVGFVAWQKFGTTGNNNGIVSGNGRIEAVEIDISTKTAGRVKDILVREGEFVAAGQMLATMDSETLEAQLRQAEAQLQQALSSVATAQSQLAQRESEKGVALAAVRQRESDLVKARQHSSRTAELVKVGAIAKQDADDDYAQLQNSEAAVNSARAQVAASEAAVMAVRTQIIGAESAVKAASANVERIKVDIRDCALKSPRDGRVQYRVAQPGEVVGAGGRVLSLVDLSDVYMTFFPDGGGREGCARHGGAAGLGCRSTVCHSSAGIVHFRCSPIHT
jgi:HlyD family secretion protein